MNALNISAAVCSCISLLFLLLALGSDSWLEGSEARFGLWKQCYTNSCVMIGVEKVLGSLHAVRTFMFLGMFAGAVSLGGLCTMLIQPSLGNISLGFISYIASFTAGLCVMIAMAVFTGQFDSVFNVSNVPYGWSFGLGWASFPLYLITGSLRYLISGLKPKLKLSFLEFPESGILTMWWPVLFLKIISPILLSLSSAMLFSGMFTYNWVVRPTAWGIYYEDLMASCINSSCSSLNRGWEYEVFVIGLLGTAGSYSALLPIIVLLMYIFKTNKTLLKKFKESILMPVGATLIAMSVYTGYYTNEVATEDRGYSFWLAWSAFIVSFVAAFAAMCLIIFQEIEEEEEILEVIPGI